MLQMASVAAEHAALYIGQVRDAGMAGVPECAGAEDIRLTCQFCPIWSPGHDDSGSRRGKAGSQQRADECRRGETSHTERHAPFQSERLSCSGLVAPAVVALAGACGWASVVSAKCASYGL